MVSLNSYYVCYLFYMVAIFFLFIPVPFYLFGALLEHFKLFISSFVHVCLHVHHVCIMPVAVRMGHEITINCLYRRL